MIHRRERSRGPLPDVRQRPTTNPILPVVDLPGAMEFYVLLGFESVAYDEHYAWIRHCGWEWFHLRRVESVEHNQASAYLHVDDANAWRSAMIEACGGTIPIADAADMPWGKREFSLVDPAGNLIRIGSNA